MIVEQGNPEMTETLLAHSSSQAAVNSLNYLAAAILKEKDSQVGSGTVTIEDVVKEIVKPLVKEWLDANLPSLVERLVKYEIEQISQKVVL